MTDTTSVTEQVEAVLTRLTLEEKAALLSGADFWTTLGIERAGVPSVMVTDGPYGLRKQPTDGSDHLGIGGSAPATCFPPPVALGSAFDPELVARVGAAIGEEAKQEDVAVVLGPGVNIKRSPLCGRNFEYYSEDPILAGDLGAAWIRGIQSRGVGSSLKHFAANNQETGRMSVSAEVDERPLQETYLRPFRIAVEARPWTVMCAYNRVNGEFASQNAWLLTETLRHDWGFDGLVVSDWGAVLDRAASVAAGLDLEMPGTGEIGPNRVVAAVAAGELDIATVDASVRRVVRLALLGDLHRDPESRYDPGEHHGLAREAATRGAVLLKNDGILPLDPGTPRIAVIGEFARTPRFQGAGSSQIVPTRLDSALDAIREQASGIVDFAPGFTFDDDADEELASEAVSAASAADVAVVFLGLPSSYESEGYDRSHLSLPSTQLELLRRVVAANPRTAVVLSNGSVVQVTPWIDSVPAVLEGWLLGQAGGSATADLLFGAANPSGKLTETIPLRIEDNPSYLNFPGEAGHVRYGEGIYVGYRWYDAKDLAVAFPFGFGLSYTTFAYADLTLRATGEGIEATFSVTNTGAVRGREIAQVYAAPVASRVDRPERELKGYASVELAPGETADVTVVLTRANLAYFDASGHRWALEGGGYRVEVGSSSRDIRLSGTAEIEGDGFVPRLGVHSTVGEWLDHPIGGPILADRFAELTSLLGLPEGPDGDFILKMIAGSRLSAIATFTQSGVSIGQLEQFVAHANGGDS
ncbi:glycoside hydrolase family 3 C-terminal domain-containing protein [Propionicicella superfundia]|uniref:glycoside hydrolase family 3 C-terminal domain-containing protein n=1 Tax=Propionicicella superfundia TaxID=348582 RepID=UPI00041B18E8|nr:glycoside hydrolase family 3 C-terminal domain-containing protein [Propionicicella superfundia]